MDTISSQEAEEPLSVATGFHEIPHDIQGTLEKSSIDSPPDLWSRAYESLKRREPDVTKGFECLLSPNGTPFKHPDQIGEAIKWKLKDRDERKVVLTLAGKPIQMREQGEKIIKFVIWSKDYISQAVSAEPHAALAWAGVSFLLPVGPPAHTNHFID